MIGRPWRGRDTVQAMIPARTCRATTPPGGPAPGSISLEKREQRKTTNNNNVFCEEREEKSIYYFLRRPPVVGW